MSLNRVALAMAIICAAVLVGPLCADHFPTKPANADRIRVICPPPIRPGPPPDPDTVPPTIQPPDDQGVDRIIALIQNIKDELLLSISRTRSYSISVPLILNSLSSPAIPSAPIADDGRPCCEPMTAVVSELREQIRALQARIREVEDQRLEINTRMIMAEEAEQRTSLELRLALSQLDEARRRCRTDEAPCPDQPSATQGPVTLNQNLDVALPETSVSATARSEAAADLKTAMIEIANLRMENKQLQTDTNTMKQKLNASVEERQVLGDQLQTLTEFGVPISVAAVVIVYLLPALLSVQWLHWWQALQPMPGRRLVFGRGLVDISRNV